MLSNRKWLYVGRKVGQVVLILALLLPNISYAAPFPSAPPTVHAAQRFAPPASAAAVPADLPNEGFESDALPDGWSVSAPADANGGWVFDNPLGQTNGTGGANKFAVVYQAKTAAQKLDVELRTPTLDLTNATQVTLKFSYAFYSYSNDLTVDVSTDDGATWANVWSLNGNAPVRPQALALSSKLAGKANVKVRFRYKPSYLNSSKDLFVQLDDVAVEAFGTPSTPTNFTATASSEQNFVNLAWGFAGTGSTTGFKVERSPDGNDPWTQIGQTASSELTLRDFNVECGKTYSYRVRAYNPAKASANSSTATATVRACDLPLIEVNQAVGQANGRFVAGKDTAIIVYLKDPVKVDDTKQTVEVKRDGEVVATLKPAAAPDATDTLIFLCESRGDCGDWAAGKYNFTATIDTQTATLSDVDFVTRAPIRLLAVKLIANYGGQIKQINNNDWKQPSELFKKILPVSADDFIWDVREQPLNVSQYNLLESGFNNPQANRGEFAIFGELRKLQPAKCQENNNCYAAIIGFVPNSWGAAAGKYFAGAIITAPGAEVHELGHALGLGDEYPGGNFNCEVNPPPASYKDSAQKNCPNSTTLPYTYKTAGGGTYSTGVLIQRAAHAFDIGKGSFVNTEESRWVAEGAGQTFVGPAQNIMTNSGPRWIHPDTWKYFFDKGKPDPAPAVQAAAKNAVTPQQVVDLSGVILSTGEAFLYPGYAYTTTMPSEPISSTYGLAGLDENDQPIFNQGIAVDFGSDDATDSSGASTGLFETTVPLYPNVVAFGLYSGDTLMKKFPIQVGNIITLALTIPTLSNTLAGEQTVEWTGSNSANVPLYYTLEYLNAQGDQNPLVLADAIKDTQLLVNFDQLPGSAFDGQSYLRLIASDGVNTQVVTSPAFQVAGAKPTAYIEDPTAQTDVTPLSEDVPEPITSTVRSANRFGLLDDNPYVYLAGEAVVLRGGATDPQDGLIDGDTSLTWSMTTVSAAASPTAKAVNVGTGAQVVIEDLAVGTHVVTLRATNSLGLTSEFTIPVQILSTQTLNVAKAGGGSGTVTSDPVGVDCGEDCVFTWATGAMVTLTAEAATGSVFTGWSGGCTGTSTTCEVTLDAAKTVTANFDLVQTNSSATIYLPVVQK